MAEEQPRQTFWRKALNRFINTKSRYKGGSRSVVYKVKMGQNKKAGAAKEEEEVPGPPQVEDKSKMIMEVSPGKKGCSSYFPWGGKITVPSGVFKQKKEKLIAKMISPSERHIHTPPLQEAERLISEMVLLVARNCKFSSAVTLEIPCVAENTKQRDVLIRAKYSGEQQWSTIDEFTIDPKTNLVKFETVSSGLFVVTSTPRTERFEATPQGCLYNARINRYISVRIPKKAIDRTVTCEIRIQHVESELIDIILTEYPQVCNDIISISHFYDVRFPDVEMATFKRAFSIKLPNTMCVEEQHDELMDNDVAAPGVEDIVVMHKTSEGWTLVEQTLRFTPTSVSFDVKTLGRFLLIRHKPDRVHRLKLAVPTIEERILQLKGEILVSASLCEKSWRLLVDVTDQDMESVLAAERMEATWKQINKEEVDTYTADNELDSGFRKRRMMIPKEVIEDPQGKPLILFNATVYRLEISGDIKILEGTSDERLSLQYHEKLTDNFTYFDIFPKPKEMENGVAIPNGTRQHFAGCMSVYSQTASDENKENDSKSEVLVRKFLIRYNQKQLDDFYYVEPVIEIEEKPSFHEEPVVIVHKPKEEEATKSTGGMTASMSRLTKPKHSATRTHCKEPKVLSGRSLKILSGAVEHGLTLAVHLNLPDSTITGLGFDSIANGLSMQDVTYKVLMHWKRTFKGSKEDQVKELVESIKDLGKVDVSAVVMDRYRRDIELSPDCFDY